MGHYDENIYTDRVNAIEKARRDIYEDSLRFDISSLWRDWSIGGLSKRVMAELGLTEISGDPRWNSMLDDNVKGVYLDELGRVWVVEENYGTVKMCLSASDISSFEKIICKHYSRLCAA